MFRHQKVEGAVSGKEENFPVAPLQAELAPGEPEKKNREASLGTIQELLEKNLKWSQIIYEQNRRLSHKLLWSAVASWMRMLIIVIPIILGIIFLPPLIKQFTAKYRGLLNGAKSGQPAGSSSSLEEMLKLLPVNPDQKEQLKALLK